jgi:hypothetical protein
MGWQLPTRPWARRDRLPGWEHGTVANSNARRPHPVWQALACTALVGLAIAAVRVFFS